MFCPYMSLCFCNHSAVRGQTPPGMRRQILRIMVAVGLPGGARPADPSGGRIHLDPEETIVSTDAVVPTGLASTTELVLEGLQDGGRLLLMIAMTLFLSYFLFMLGAVLFSTTADRVRSARVRHRRDDLEGLRSARKSRSAPQRISA